MRRLVITLALSLLLVFNPGLVFHADANPGQARVDTEKTVLTTTDAAALALPIDTTGLTVQYAEAPVPHRTGVAGVTWAGGQMPRSVFVREVRATGVPSEWKELHVEAADPAEPGNGRAGSEPWVMTGVRRVQVATVSDAALTGSVGVYASPNAETVTSVGVSQAKAATTSYAWSNPQILSRASWGANESLVRYAYTYARVTGAMIHHTAGSSTYTEADVPGILRSIQAYHVNGRGWNDIAYNILVDKFGRAWEGRGGGVDKAVQGGHAYGVTNARTTGISMIGNYQTAQPSSAMLDTAERVIGWKFALHGVDPYGTTSGSGGQDGGSTFLNAISGHRDENATDCPGQYVYSQFSTIRSKVASYKAQYAGGGTSTPPTASAGADQTVSVGQPVTLDASASTAGSTFAWSQTGGSPVTLSSTTAAKPTFTAATPGTLTFSVRVTKGGASASDTVVVTVRPDGTTNLARATGVTATASSQTTGSEAAKAIDGVVSGYPADSTREWTSDGGGANSWITLAFRSPVSVSRVVLHDRPNTNDHVTAGRLTFSDGSSVPVGALANAGGATVVTFPARTVTSVRFTATAVAATTENIGLAEFEAWGTVAPTASPTPTVSPTPTASPTPSVSPTPTVPPVQGTNLARAAGARVSASSQVAGQEAAKAVDGVAQGYPADSTKEWATDGGGVGTTFSVTLPGASSVNRIVLYDRPNANDRITAGRLVFSDGTTVAVPSLANTGTATTVTFAARTVTSVRLEVTGVSSTTENVGLAEFEVWGTRASASPTALPTPSADPDAGNVAAAAGVTVTASSEEPGSEAANAVDGVVDGYPTDPTAEWTTVRGLAGSWIQLAFPAPATVSRVVLHDRPNANDHVTGGTLRFSDGSTMRVPALANAGTATAVTFSPRTTSGVRFTADSVAPSTENVGLAELEVWGIGG